MKVAAIGECMVELSPREIPREVGGETGLFGLGFGGDTLNTAVYLARLGVAVDYATALGDDSFSDRMIAAWRADGVGTDLVIRRPGRLPGLYLIENDPLGERQFYYWRETAPARELFALPETDRIVEALAGYDWLYLSGISLSLYGQKGRAVLFDALDRARRNGCRIAFDSNFRPRTWPDAGTAHRAMAAMLQRTDIMLTGSEDERLLFGERDLRAAAHRYRAAGVAEVVAKGGAAGVLVVTESGEIPVPPERVERVVDATAAGDSFNAAYLAARFAGLAPRIAAGLGHRLAAVVIGHRGAIIPPAAMQPVVRDFAQTVRSTKP